MVEEAVARARILEATGVLASESVPLRKARGRFLAEPLRARVAHPRFDNSMVDGYAVRVEDGLAERKIVGEQAAGADGGWRLGVGEAIRIFTGAPLPAGCDAVVMQEEVLAAGGRCVFREAATLGENVRRAGADVAEGQMIARAGDPVTPQLIGLLAAQGYVEIPVHGRPRVTILSTGDELRLAGETLAAGEIYESNAPMLAALLEELGIFPIIRRVADDLAGVKAEIALALAESDVLLLSGGVSVGDHDYVRPALAALGIELDLWRIRLRPGKPLAFARSEGRLIFGLPGNPVSAFVTFLLLARPAIQKMLGASEDRWSLRGETVQVAQTLRNAGDRPHYMRGMVTGHQFTCARLQESHALFALSQSNALLRLDAGETVAEGTMREVLQW